jgi:thiazolinyl imide reductase
VNPLNILVCGTNYGRTYLEAVKLGGASYHLAGILTRGSANSRALAREYGIPLYICIEDLGLDIELACAAMGTSGFDVVLGLLGRGIHVLCEHPCKPGRLQVALDIAGSRSLCFHINGHFADLEAAAVFISHCRRESASVPLFIHVMATDRSLYAALDILRRVLRSFAPFQFQVTSRLLPFTIIQGVLNGVPCTFNLQSTEGSPLPDGSSAYLIDHRITVGFPSGILTLLSMNGPVVWNANLSCVAHPNQPLFTMAHEDHTLTSQLLWQQRVAANLAAISTILKSMNERSTPPQQAPEYLMDVSRAWETIGGLM